MRKILLLTYLMLGTIAAASAQSINYTGGTYIQNFDSLSQDTVTTTGFPLFVPTSNTATWTDGSTLNGWYANQNTYTTNPALLGLSLVNQMTSTGTGSDRALGSYLGTVALLNPITYGFQIHNGTGSTLQQFTLSFTAEQFTKDVGTVLAADVLNSFDLAYSTNATDVSGAGATNYISVANAGSNVLGLNVLNTATDTHTLSFTVNNLNLANNGNLWIAFQRTGLLGVTDTAVSIDDLSFSASAVPEPSTYMLIGLGLGALMLCRKMRMSAANTPVPAPATSTTTPPATPAGRRVVWPFFVVLATFAIAQSLSAAPANFNLSTDSQNKLWFDSGTSKTVVSDKALRQNFSGDWGSCKISQGTNENGKRVVLVSLDSTATAPASFTFNGRPLKVSPGATTTIYPDANTVASASDPLAMEEVVVKASAPANTTYAFDENKSVTDGSIAHPNRSYTYRPVWNSMITRNDFDKVYSQSNAKDELFIVNPGQYHEGVDLFVIALSENAPQNIWVRHESFIIPTQTTASLSKDPFLVPVTRPDQLMQVLESQDLFPNATSYTERADAFYKLLPQINQCSVQVQALLKKWDSGEITPAELKTLGSASKISWLVQAHLINGNAPGDENAFGQFFGQVNVNLNPEATSAF